MNGGRAINTRPQREKYRPKPKPEDLCKCTPQSDGISVQWGTVTHQFPYFDKSNTRLFSRFRYVIDIDGHSAGPQGDKTFRYCQCYNKTFAQHKFVLYGAPRIAEAVKNNAPYIYLVEGEKDAEAIWEFADQYATTSHLGVSFYPEIAEHFRGYQGYVIIVVDRDHLDPRHQADFNHEDPKKRKDYPGSARAIRVARALKSVGVKYKFREANRKGAKDAYDQLAKKGKVFPPDEMRTIRTATLQERAPREWSRKGNVKATLSGGDMPEGPALKRVVAAFEAKGYSLDKIGPSRYKTNCPHPEHDDRNPSFEFDQGDEGAVLTCESRPYETEDIAEKEKILQELGLTWQDLFDKRKPTTRKVKLQADPSKQVEAHEWPAFHDAFKGHIGTTTNNEPNDKGNGKRMLELYGKVFRKVNTGPETGWRVWTGTHWGMDTSGLAMAATADLTSYMEAVEVFDYEDQDCPAFPSDWDVLNASGKPYKALLGRYGAFAQAPAQTMAYAAKGAEQADFLGERLAWEQSDNIFQRTLQWIEKCKDGARMREAVKQLEHQPGISVTDEEFDNVRGTFCVQNGEIDTHTLELGPHKLEDMNTRISPVAYRPNAQAPIWEAYLATNQPNEDTRRYLQKLAGYAMSGDGDQKLIAFMYSRLGDTGKSLFLKVIERVLGSTYSATLAEGALSKRRFDTGGRDPDRDAIRGKRFVVSSELAPNEPLDERFVKQLTGGDGVSTRGNYSREGNTRWQPECLVLVATNHLSRINAEDEAIWNRIQVVPWNVAFPKGHPDRDEKLADKILGDGGFPGEQEGVLAWIVEGLRLYREEGLFPPEEVQDASMGYRTNADIVQRWLVHASSEGDIEIGEHSEEKDGERYVCQVTPLHSAFEAWSKKEHARDIPGLQAFGRRLEELGYEKIAKYRRDPYKGRAVIVGIRMSAEGSFRLELNKE
ncbi:DNA primase/helicase [Streptomyces phage Lizz]|nr:DNA primase/helicase [Streptomyces phage Lizz]